MSYYVYENWTAEHKAVIHRGSCRNCNEGRGCHDNPLGNRNGKWHGPFDSLEDAKKQQQIQVGSSTTSLCMKDLQILAKIDSRCKTNKARGI